jgi:hypothetical protein
MSAEELTEGEPIVPKARQVWRDATRWKILSISKDPDIVKFQAGTYLSSDGIEMPVIFECYKDGMIYREWEKEARRRDAGGQIEEPYLDVEVVRGRPLVEVFAREESEKKFAPVVRLVDSQLEERQHRLREMRKKFRELDWGDEKDRLLSEIVALEKRVLGDPC